MGADARGDKVIPLHGKLYTKRGFGFKSENLEILSTVDEVIGTIGTREIWTLDRGGDRQKLFTPFLEKDMQFVVRMTSPRDMINRQGQVRNIAAIAQSTRCAKRVELTIHPKGDIP